jgi:rubrerythrin
MIFGFNAAEVFDVAIAIEENGKNFYEQSQALINDPDVKKLFAELALQEVEHKKKFQTLQAGLPAEASTPTTWDPDNKLSDYIKMMADQHVFVTDENMGSRLAGVKSTKDALRLAIEFEKDSVIFFLTMQDAAEGKKAREFIGLLVKEEQDHLRRLSTELRRLN